MGRALHAVLGSLECALKPAAVREELQVLMAGLPRAGSSSLKLALERLSFAALHGSETYTSTELSEALLEPNAAQVLELTETFGFNATLEYHTVCWEELFALRPQGRVILLTRDFKRWYNSVVRIQEASQINYFPLNYLLASVEDYLQKLWGNLARADGPCAFGKTCALNGEKHRALWRETYDNVHRRVREVVPSEQLLIMNLSGGDGYAKLCPFLGIAPEACPDEPFPRANSSGEVKAYARFMMALEIASIVLLLLLLALVWRCLGRCCGQRPRAESQSNCKPKAE